MSTLVHLAPRRLCLRKYGEALGSLLPCQKELGRRRLAIDPVVVGKSVQEPIFLLSFRRTLRHCSRRLSDLAAAEGSILSKPRNEVQTEETPQRHDAQNERGQKAPHRIAGPDQQKGTNDAESRHGRYDAGTVRGPKGGRRGGRLVLGRHGEPDWQVDGQIQGQQDVDRKQDQGDMEDGSKDALVVEQDVEESRVGGCQVRHDHPGNLRQAGRKCRVERGGLRRHDTRARRDTPHHTGCAARPGRADRGRVRTGDARGAGPETRRRYEMRAYSRA